LRHLFPLLTIRCVHIHRPLVALLALAALAACGGSHAVPSFADSDIIISRVMADPTVVSDERGEWIEIANLGADSTDLRGWQLSSARDPGFTVARSLVVPPGGTVILGRAADSSTNGGVHVDLVYTGIVLGNAGDWVALHDARGVTADSVEWNIPPAGVAIDHRAEHHTKQVSPSTPKPEPTPSVPRAITPATPETTRATPGQSELVVRVLDIGQGDAILIQNGGSTVLIDGGPNPAVLGHQLDALGLNGSTIDAVILTHAHSDHYQGLRELFATRRHITIRYFWENQDPSTNVTLGKLRDSIASRVRAGSLIYRDTDDPCANGRPICTVTLKGRARIHIMRPDPNVQDPNNRSPAIKVVGPDSASFTMWMAGDAETEGIGWFSRAGYQRAPGMRVDVLKADHHGSCNGVTDPYLDLLKPSLVVASLGAVNDYGHMHAQAKATYERHGIPWYRTDQNGMITLRSAGVPGSKYSVSVERGAKNMAGPSDRRSAAPGCEGM
jgi:competence protein ComEC